MSKEISIFQTGTLDAMVKFSEIMATAVATIPKHFQDKPGDCLAVIMQADRWGMDPYVVAGKTHVVNGNLGYEAQLVNAVVSSSTAIIGDFEIEYSPDDWKSDNDPKAWCRVGAIRKGHSEITWGQKVYPSKQTVKNSPLWKTDPQQQTAYLAIKKWARLYTPAVLLGVYTSDELPTRAQQQEQEKEVGPMGGIDIPVGTNTETGEIPDQEPPPPTVQTLKKLMDDCDAIDRMKAYSDLMGKYKDSFSLEEQADLKTYYINRCEALKAELKPLTK